MGEGVDPTQMCQTLVHKVAQSKQLMAVTDPDVLGLFESWLDELEEEVVAHLRRHPDGDPVIISTALGLSQRGAAFLVAKLRREKKI
jgi:hypothetical protein